jgi:predicted metalloprotease with PDZ domain
MVPYTFSIENPNQQYIAISVHFKTNAEQTTFRIPAWRPGRYELGNFAKNVKNLRVFDDQNKRLEVKKTNKDTWVIDSSSTKMIRVEYSYYAAELNAGSTFLSPDLLYVNPVNCCIYTTDQADEELSINLSIPDNWKIACSMKQDGKTLYASNFDELADSPFICAEKLLHETYISGETTFHIWFNGEVKPDWNRLLKDFQAFTDKQIEKFIEFPVSEYHFLFHILPYKAYHGVEHTRSTVITLGPSYDVFGSLYKELLGISSHELYHTWNVKTIRPIEMQPYDFSKENYSRLGYICEGITTYMGDLFLLKSGVFNLRQYLNELTAQFQKHFDNSGRFNYSVSESSFDTWLDGYVPGVPGRKVSIYTEGCLLALVTDVMILKATSNKYGLDEVMKRLYFNYALKGKGVSETDYKAELESICGHSFDSFFTGYVNGTAPYEAILTDALEYLGLELSHFPSSSYAAARLGMKVVQNGNGVLVTAMYPGGPAQLGGLMLNDELIGVNGIAFVGDMEKWCAYFDENEKTFTVKRAGRLLEIKLPEVQRNFYMEYSIERINEPNVHQKKGFEAWSSKSSLH